ncbi:putative leucine carboxyl methyltransferase [Gregarina niphandrodes]|uniref:Leucine carboxyl methyltransferase n=1 Tax=Gregarina niphandrodes TaxID=110365 RepID=A0A023BBU8_GRENI|nr:putative leucine carboxyl methyltransferase [Gregarina niphandrodes]EZG80167.1 putative leucine carboxyl methyltransferase [Gregarina niphandrodes]|eukprot:XP_011134324.1 putative leucine carboxyl methyltransferase [Gregarina niphandrodes]
MRSISSYCRSYCLISYDMFNVYDRFGRVMKENLNRRGCEILSTSRFRSVSEIRDHVTQLLPSRSVDGGSGPVVKAVDMDTYYSKYITAIEKFRIEQLELFDEMEEWRLIQEHYFVLALTNMRGLKNFTTAIRWTIRVLTFPG